MRRTYNLILKSARHISPLGLTTVVNNPMFCLDRLIVSHRFIFDNLFVLSNHSLLNTRYFDSTYRTWEPVQLSEHLSKWKVQICLHLSRL